jgi:hypothetical protein
MDCGAPPSPTNPYVNFSPSADGQPIRQIVTGKPKDDSVVPLSNVSLFGDNRLQLSFPQGSVTVTVILIKDQRRIRPYQSVASDGNVSVKDGIVQSGGQQTRWLNKCAG